MSRTITVINLHVYPKYILSDTKIGYFSRIPVFWQLQYAVRTSLKVVPTTSRLTRRVRVRFRLRRQTPHTTLFRSLSVANKTEHGDTKVASASRNPGDGTATAALAATLREYFFLKVPLAPLYRRWSEGDTRMAAVAAYIPGVRVVR